MKRLIILLCLPLALWAQPQSPNFVMSSETFSALASRDSTANYLLISSVGQLSIADTHANPNFVFTSGFLAPVLTSTSPEISVNRDTLNFGDIWIAEVGADSFTITNLGNADLIVDSIQSDHPLFPSLVLPLIVPPLQSHTVVYHVQIPETLSYAAHLTFHSNSDDFVIALLVHGIWTGLSANPQSVDMGIIAVGDSADAELELVSEGNTGLSITDVALTANHFIIAQEPEQILGAYDSTSMVVRFHAAASGVFFDTLIISHSVGDDIRIPLSAGATAADDRDMQIPAVFLMDQNYPNPFNPSTTIRFGLPRVAEITIAVFDVLGRRAATLVSGKFEAGFHSVNWNCAECPTGLYIARLISPDATITRKLLLLK